MRLFRRLPAFAVLKSANGAVLAPRNAERGAGGVNIGIGNHSVSRCAYRLAAGDIVRAFKAVNAFLVTVRNAVCLNFRNYCKALRAVIAGDWRKNKAVFFGVGFNRVFVCRVMSVKNKAAVSVPVTGKGVFPDRFGQSVHDNARKAAVCKGLFPDKDNAVRNNNA